MKTIETRGRIEEFVNSFLLKIDIWGIIFIDRKKNDAALLDLGITSAQRTGIIKTIVADDYIETIIDEASYGDMWVFGKDFCGYELYIKVSLGRPCSNTLCISFHKSEYPNNYAYKEVLK